MYIYPENGLSFSSILFGTIVGIGAVATFALGFANYDALKSTDGTGIVTPPTFQAQVYDISDALVVTDAQIQQHLETLSRIEPAAGDAVEAASSETQAVPQDGTYRNTIIH